MIVYNHLDLLVKRFKEEEKKQRIINKVLLHSNFITKEEYHYRTTLYKDAVAWLSFFVDFFPYVVGKNTLPADKQIEE